MLGRRVQRQVDGGMVLVASVLLLGVLVLAAGYLAGHRVALYAGLLVTLAGVLTGIQRLAIHGGPGRARR